ncbi:hypothetical protein [Dysgonomonas sp. ZJ709]|uniref:hypothetical protein n=1 Tax=Dysgonomonas sp. ZJ709 TaxID=2709797 RepID=UPI0013EC8767|nr:hypothetical protein [Dysgonomonas sp. ZJ709]
MKILQEHYVLLKIVNSHIEDLLSSTVTSKELRLADVYEYIKNKDDTKQVFANSTELSQFLRAIAIEDVKFLTQVIPSCSVDMSNFIKFQWRFYPRERKLKKETTIQDKNLATSTTQTVNIFPRSKIYKASNGVKVRSMQELHIYNKLLSVKNFHIDYDFQIKGKGKIYYADFKITNNKTESEFIWEHFGLIGHPDYDEQMCKKLEWYKDIGYEDFCNAGQFIVTIHRTDEEFSSLVDKIISQMKKR